MRRLSQQEKKKKKRKGSIEYRKCIFPRIWSHISDSTSCNGVDVTRSRYAVYCAPFATVESQFSLDCARSRQREKHSYSNEGNPFFRDSRGVALSKSIRENEDRLDMALYEVGAEKRRQSWISSATAELWLSSLWSSLCVHSAYVQHVRVCSKGIPSFRPSGTRGFHRRNPKPGQC